MEWVVPSSMTERSHIFKSFFAIGTLKRKRFTLKLRMHLSYARVFCLSILVESTPFSTKNDNLMSRNNWTNFLEENVNNFIFNQRYCLLDEASKIRVVKLLSKNGVLCVRYYLLLNRTVLEFMYDNARLGTKKQSNILFMLN